MLFLFYMMKCNCCRFPADIIALILENLIFFIQNLTLIVLFELHANKIF